MNNTTTNTNNATNNTISNMIIKEANEMNINMNDTTVKTRIAYNIIWDVDDVDTEDAVDILPSEIKIPDDITDLDEISDYLSDETGFCHFGFKVKEI